MPPGLLLLTFTPSSAVDVHVLPDLLQPHRKRSLMPPSSKDKNGGTDKDKIPVTSSAQLVEELKAFKAALSIKETEHTWEALDRAVKRFTAVTRGGGCRYEAEYVAGLKDRDLARAIVGCLSTERTQLSASTLLFLSAATRLGQSFSPLVFLYLPHVIRLLSRTNKLYISRATACLLVIISNTRLAGVIPYLREGMLEKSPSHRKGCMSGLLCALGGPDPLSPVSKIKYEGMTVDRDIVHKKYLDDVETCIRIGARDKDIEIRKIAKKCWEIYRSEFSERVAHFAAPLTPIARKYLELPPAGLPVPDYSNNQTRPQLPVSTTSRTTTRPPERVATAHPAPVRQNPLPPPPRAPSPLKAAMSHGPVTHTVQRGPSRSQMSSQPPDQPTQSEQKLSSQQPASLASSHGHQARPPTTLFARRVLPNSTGASVNVQQRIAPVATHLTTFYGPRDPVASTSHAPPILPKSHTAEALHRAQSSESLSWPAHQRAVTAPNVSILPEALTKPFQDSQAAVNRPASSCSLGSEVNASSSSPAKEPFRPSSSVGSRQVERSVSPPSVPAESATATGIAAYRPIHTQQQRAVPAQAHRAPARNPRRASRVMPPSADLQAFLSSTATDAASEFKWPLAAPTAQTSVSTAVEVPSKRPASVMSIISQTYASTGTVRIERDPASHNDIAPAIDQDFTSRHLQEHTTSHYDESQRAERPHSSDHVQHQEAKADSPRQPLSPNTEAVENLIPTALAPHVEHKHESAPSVQVEQPTPQRILTQTEGAHSPAMSSQPVLEGGPPVEQATTQKIVTSDSGTGIQTPSSTEDPLAKASEPSTPGTASGAAAPVAQEYHPASQAARTDEHAASPARLPLESAKMPRSDSTRPPQGGSQPAADVALPTVTSALDIAKLAASLHTASTSLSTSIRPTLAGSRQKTAFRPQKHRRQVASSTTEVRPAHAAESHAPLTPFDPQHSLGLTPMDPPTVAHTHAIATEYEPVVRNPLSASLPGKSRPLLPPAVSQQPRSVSTSVAGAVRSKPAHASAQPASSARPAAGVRALAPSNTRLQASSESTRPPPAKKQVLSSSTGSSSSRPAFSAGGSRTLSNPAKSKIAAENSRPAAKPASAARQGSIFSRLAAPTAASAARAKPKVASEVKESFKKPALPSGSLSKKSSSVSLKSSHGPSGIPGRTLKDSTNQRDKPILDANHAMATTKSAARVEAPKACQNGDEKRFDPSADKVAVEVRLAGEIPQHSLIASEEQVHQATHAYGHGEKAAEPQPPQTVEDNGHSQNAAADLERPQDKTAPVSDAISVPLPSSPHQGEDKLHSMLAELGLTSNLLPVHSISPAKEASPSLLEEVQQQEIEPFSSDTTNMTTSEGPAVRESATSAASREPPPGMTDHTEEQTMADTPGSTLNTPAAVVEEGLSLTPAGDVTILGDDPSADRTTIVHSLDDEENVNTGCDQAPQETDHEEGTPDALLSNTISAAPLPSDAFVRSTEIVTHASSSEPSLSQSVAASPISLVNPDTHSQTIVLPQNIALPQDQSLAQDPSLSLLMSPTRGMQDLLARSIGRKAEEEGSPLLQEKEYLPSLQPGQYEYDDTILDAYSSAPIDALGGGEEAQVKNADAEANSSDHEDPAESQEEEDEIALLISRELSSDSLEELASRWEESRVITASLGLLDETNDTFDFENTPMRPKLLTRFSDGESSDYGQAPVDAGAYTKDDEDAALDILLSMGNQGTMGWSEKGAIFGDSIHSPSIEQSAQAKGTADRGILAEMSAFGDTPRVVRNVAGRKEGGEAGPSGSIGSSILREGGIF